MHRSEKKGLKLEYKIGIYVLVFLLIIVVYLGLNVWAISKVELDMSLDSIKDAIKDFSMEVESNKTRMETTVTIRNPTLVPMITTRLDYNVNYGESSIANGGTEGWIFVMPLSEKDVPVYLDVDYEKLGTTVVGAVLDFIKGERKQFSAEVYGNFGPVRMQLRKI